MRKVTVVKLDSALIEQYRKLSRKRGRPMNHIIEDVLRLALEKALAR